MEQNIILKFLRKTYPEARCPLIHRDPLQLLVATILSAQCTDERVNKVTPPLFAKYKNVEAFAKAKPKELERLIHSTGFYKAKARNIIACCKGIIASFKGKVPNKLDDLVTLAGVGRKTANVVLSEVWGIPGVVVDTHVKRLAYRLGLTKNTDPEKIEQDLMKIFPKDGWNDLSICLIFHGRRICFARKPLCDKCGLAEICPKKGLNRTAYISSSDLNLE